MNTTEIKKTIYSYINNMIANEMMDGARVVHFSRDTQTPVFKMLVSERHIRKIKNGQMVDRFEKVKEGDANEALDCTVYCCGLAWTMGVRNLYGKQYQEVYKINVLEKVAYMEKKANPEVPAKQLVKPKKKAFINNNGYWK